MKKALKIILIVLGSIVAIAIIALHLTLHCAGFRNAILNKAIDGVVDAKAGIAKVELKPGKHTNIVLRDIQVNYPKANPTTKMLGIDSVCISANLWKYLKEKQIEVDKAQVLGLEAYLTERAMSMLKTTPQEEDQTDSTAFTIPDLRIDNVVLDIRKAQYLNMVDAAGVRLDATASVQDGQISAKVGFGANSAALTMEDIRLKLGNLKLTAAVDQGAVPQEKKGPRRRGRETPDFLSEADFRTSDLDLHLDKQTSAMIVGWNPSMTLALDTASIICGSFPMNTSVSAVSMRADLDRVDVDSLVVRAGSSDMMVKGHLKGLRRFFFGDGGVLFADMVVRSKNLNASEILSALGSQTDTLATAEEVEAPDSTATMSSIGKLIVVPANLIANVDLMARHLSYADYNVRGFHTRITMRERCVLLTDVNARTEYGNLRADAFYSTRTKQDISAGFDLKLSKVTAENVIGILPVMDEIVPGFSTFKGDMNFAIAAKTKLDTTMQVITPTMNGVVHIDGDRLSIDQTPQIRKVTKWMLLKDRNVIDLHDLNINGTISDNTVTIFPFSVTADRYCVLLGGDYNLSGSMDYRVTILKAPLLFKLGVRAFGGDFSHIKVRLCKPQFRNLEFPTFEQETATIFKEIRSDVRGVLGEGVVQTMNKGVGIRRMQVARKDDFNRLRLFEDLPESQQKSLETLSKEAMLPKIILDLKDARKAVSEKETSLKYVRN